MIRTDLENKEFKIAGSTDELGTECVLIMKQIAKEHQKMYGVLSAQGMLLNLVMLALSDQVDESNYNVQYCTKQEMRMADEVLTNFEDELVESEGDKE